MIEPNLIKEGLQVIHLNGIHYTVLFLANEQTTLPIIYPISVVYQGPNSLKWVKTLENFCEKFSIKES